MKRSSVRVGVKGDGAGINVSAVDDDVDDDDDGGSDKSRSN